MDMGKVLPYPYLFEIKRSSNMKVSDIEAFKDKSLADVLEEIYSTSKSKKKKIDSLIDQLADFIKDKDTALTLVPLVKEYLDVGIRNDEQLVKLATIVQRLVASSNRAGGADGDDSVPGSDFSAAQKEELRAIAKELRDSSKEISELNSRTKSYIGDGSLDINLDEEDGLHEESK